MPTKPLSRNKYAAIKIMINAGTPTKEICEYLEVSDSTVLRVRNSEDYDDYQNNRKTAAIMATAKKKSDDQTESIVSHEHNVTIIANHYMAEELRKQTQALELISNKMTHVYEILEKIRESWK